MNEELLTLVDEAVGVSEGAQQTFGQLSAEQLNWKPAPGEWSVAQCFEHLIMINSGYFPVIRRIASGGYKPSLQQRMPLLPRFFAFMILKAVAPQGARKFKINSKFQPSSSAIGGDIIARFKAHQQQVIEHMKMTENLKLDKVIITSPVASVATYSLLNAYRIVVHSRAPAHGASPARNRSRRLS